MNLIKQSKKIPHERFSFGWKLAETSRIKFGKIEQKDLKKDLDEARNTAYSDKGLYIDLSNTQRLSEDSVKWVLFIAEDVAKNNVIGLDIYIAPKPSSEVKALVDKVKQIVITKQSTAIRVKKCKKDEAVGVWQIIYFFTGIVLVVGGQFMALSKSEFKDYFNIDTNMVQILGTAIFALGVLPTLIKHRNKIFNRGDKKPDSED